MYYKKRDKKRKAIEKDSSLSCDEDIDSRLDDTNSVGHGPLTAKQIKDRERAANNVQVRCKYCYPKVLWLNNLKSHVKKVHPEFFDCRKNRLDYIAPLE